MDFAREKPCTFHCSTPARPLVCPHRMRARHTLVEGALVGLAASTNGCVPPRPWLGATSIRLASRYAVPFRY